MTLHDLVIGLVEARDASNAAKTALISKCIEVGDCEDVDSDPERRKCWQKPGNFYCDSCAAKVPLWKQRQKAARKAGAMLLRVLNVGRILIRERDAELRSDAEVGNSNKPQEKTSK